MPVEQTDYCSNEGSGQIWRHVMLGMRPQMPTTLRRLGLKAGSLAKVRTDIGYFVIQNVSVLDNGMQAWRQA